MTIAIAHTNPAALSGEMRPVLSARQGLGANRVMGLGWFAQAQNIEPDTNAVLRGEV